MFLKLQNPQRGSRRISALICLFVHGLRAYRMVLRFKWLFRAARAWLVLFPLSLLECLGLSETRSEDRKSVEMKEQRTFLVLLSTLSPRTLCFSTSLWKCRNKGSGKGVPIPHFCPHPERLSSLSWISFTFPIPHPMSRFWRIPLPGQLVKPVNVSRILHCILVTSRDPGNALPEPAGNTAYV